MPNVAVLDEAAEEVARKARAILRGPVVRAASRALAGYLIDGERSYGYERPLGSKVQRLGGEQESLGLPGTEHVLSKETEVRAHLEDAMTRDSPFGEPDEHAVPSLRAAVDYVAGFDGDGAALRDDRNARDHALSRVANSASFRACEAELEALRSEASCRVRGELARPALVHALAMGAGIPDEEFVVHQVTGFPAVGDYPDSGWFRAKEEPATRSFDGMDHPDQISAVENGLRKKARSMSREVLDELRTCTAKTKKEILKGYAYGGPDGQGFDAAGVDKLLGRGCWHPLMRFAVFQGYDEDGEEKWRVCDNARSSRTNECVGTHETLSLEDATFPTMVGALFAKAWGGPKHQLVHATDDVDAAYRRMLCRHPGASVVAFYNTDVGDVRYVLMDGHNFGLKAAVLSWNRHSQMAAELSRRYFGVVNGGYFDDHDTTEPVYAGRSGKAALRRCYEWIGVPLSVGEKDVDFGQSNPFLGVISDFSRYLAGLVTMRSKPSRIARLVCDAREFLARNSVPKDAAASFCGKAEWTATSAGANRMGRAALAALRHYSKARTEAVRASRWPVAREALEFLEAVLPNIPPRTIDVSPASASRPCVILYTDAMYTRKRGADGREVSVLGVVIYDKERVGVIGEDGEGMHCSGDGFCHTSVPVPDELLAQWGDKKTKIMQAEVLAPLLAIRSKPSWFAGRDVVSYIDNTGALCAYAKAGSSDVESAKMVHAFHAWSVMLGARVWFSWVPSKANISDLPSRREFALLQELGSDYFPPKLPTAGTTWAEILAEARTASGRRLSAKEREWRRTTWAAVHAEAQRRRARA